MARFKLDEIDHKILDMLIENTRMPFTDIAKALEEIAVYAGEELGSKKVRLELLNKDNNTLEL